MCVCYVSVLCVWCLCVCHFDCMCSLFGIVYFCAF